MRGLLVGRFQPFHLGHLSAVRAARQEHPEEEILIGVGSAQESHTPLNPFTAGERIEMVQRALAEAKVELTRVYPIPDVQRHAVWVAHVESLLPRFGRIYTNNPLTALLFEAEGYQVEAPELEDRERFQGSRIRDRIRFGQPIEDLVPAAVLGFLDEISGIDRIRLLSAQGASVTPEHPK